MQGLLQNKQLSQQLDPWEGLYNAQPHDIACSQAGNDADANWDPRSPQAQEGALHALTHPQFNT
jgi:hypothetical protein